MAMVGWLTMLLAVDDSVLTLGFCVLILTGVFIALISVVEFEFF